MAFTSTEAAAILKEHYPFTKVAEAGYLQNKFLALVPKVLVAGGDQEKIPIDVSPNQARSATFGTAQTLAASLSSVKRAFELTTVSNYAIARVSGKVIRQTKQDAHAFVRAVDSEIKSAFKSISRDIERDLFRAGDGAIGSYLSNSTVTLTLGNATQAHCFEYGMELVSAANNTSALNNTGGANGVTSVNRAGGTLVSDIDWSTPWSGVSAGHLIFCQGDYVSSSDRLKISGLEAWCPATAPGGADSFFGVNRSIDVERLAGTRYDGSALTIEEALINGQSEGAANGAAPDTCFMAPYNVRRLINALGSKKSYEVTRETMNAQGFNGPIGSIGFQVLVIDGDEGPIRIVSDPLVPYDVAWMVKLSALTLFSMGDFPGVLDEDGQSMLRVSNDDSYEIRVGYYAQLGSQEPGCIVRVKLA